MSYLTVKQLVFGYLNLDVSLATSGSSDPDGYTQAQIARIINASYEYVSVKTKCLQDYEEISVTTTNAIYEHSIPTGYIDSFYITPKTTKDFFTRTNYADLRTFNAGSCRFFAPFKNKIYLYDATSSDDSYIHTYYKKPTALSADADELEYPLNGWERLIALYATVDLITYDTSQSAQTKKNDFKVLRDEAMFDFVEYWTMLESNNAGIFTPHKFILGEYN